MSFHRNSPNRTTWGAIRVKYPVAYGQERTRTEREGGFWIAGYGPAWDGIHKGTGRERARLHLLAKGQPDAPTDQVSKRHSSRIRKKGRCSFAAVFFMQ